MSLKDTIDDWDKWVAGVVAGLVALAYAARQLFRGLTLMVEVHDLVAGVPATDTHPAVPGIAEQVHDLKADLEAQRESTDELAARVGRVELLLSELVKANENQTVEDRP